jgi:hypothetical protein
VVSRGLVELGVVGGVVCSYWVDIL